MTNLTPKPGHVVAIPAPGYRCDFCGAPATWDIPTIMGPWANACDKHEAEYHTQPGKTGVGVGQRLIIEPEDEEPATLKGTCVGCGAQVALVKVGQGHKWLSDPDDPQSWHCGNDPAFPVRAHDPMLGKGVEPASDEEA